MRFVFRADSSIYLGTGHVARLLALAEESASRGIECVFLGDISEPDWLLRKIHSKGIKHIPLANLMELAISESDILFIDSYTLTATDPLICSKVWKRKILLADSSTPSYGVETVFYIEDLPVPQRFAKSKVHHGLKYFPLKKSLPRTQLMPPVVQKLVVVGGGTDPYNFADAMSKVLVKIGSFESAVFFSNHSNSIEKIDSRFRVTSFGENLDVEVASSELVFSTASTIALETIARGIPLGIGCAIQNQRTFYDSLVSREAAIPVGLRGKDKNWKINQPNVQILIDSAEVREKLHMQSSLVLDNQGSARVIDKVLENLN
jgi:spore coat polysaccharide biosynthesis predicted glycosyltransferase SpsG